MDHNATPSIEEEPLEFRDVEISREPIELYKILKFENTVESGGEAKAAVAAGQIGSRILISYLTFLLDLHYHRKSLGA